jgi:mono/diheme cytochrome c family protein
MSSARQRQLGFLVLATALVLAIVAPGLGGAQVATPESDSAAADLIARGEEIYSTTCITCHRPAGEGVTDVAVGGIPALAGNPFVTLEDPAPMAQTILNGRAGMPNFRSFSDEDIAAVASYVRQAWGNEAGPVDPALVGEIRAQFVVTPLPPATPISTEFPGQSLASPGALATPSGDEASPEAAGGATSGGITPIPTIGQ